ncbi:hypothetical protein Slin15195_G117570 [Septoria linicola]|uniref:Uncharacterized protein n=1 Tax=Septoria linicola TaxID=215465 RepID=A0A9Q9B6N9_9PEZI|nr:hypothetical protein Slin15195_G117570 [Septoria linicola]
MGMSWSWFWHQGAIWREVNIVYSTYSLHEELNEVSDLPIDNGAFDAPWWEQRPYRPRSNHLFHKAVDFFVTQECTRSYDKIFGILGLAKGRIEVDYTISVIDLFMATLADYSLSLGFLTDDWKGLRKRMGLMKMTLNIKEEMNLIAPFMAFELDPFDPVVYLIIHEIAGFFVPGWGKELCREATQTWWYHCCPGDNIATKTVDMITGSEPKLEFKYIAGIFVTGVKLLGSELSSYQAQDKAIRADQVSLKKDNAEMTAPTYDGDTKTHQQWVSLAWTISQRK